MKLTAKVKLEPDGTELLLRTLEAANECVNWIDQQAWETKTFQRYALHKLAYRECRSRFGLTAQVVIRAIAKVADAHKLDRNTERTFRPRGSIAYDDRILRWRVDQRLVSIWTVEGCRVIPFVGGEPQYALLQSQRGESDLIYRSGTFYLAATCEVDKAPLSNADRFLGVDLGVANIAFDSDGTSYNGSALKSVRHRQRRLRTRLQKKLAGEERRFATWVNHNVSKQIVAKAEGTGRDLALEELKGIRDRVTVGRKQRAVLHSWAFSQLRLFVAYKAERAGVPVVFIDPRNTSRECGECGHETNADFNAARVISSRAARKPAVLSELCNSAHNVS